MEQLSWLQLFFVLCGFLAGIGMLIWMVRHIIARRRDYKANIARLDALSAEIRKPIPDDYPAELALPGGGMRLTLDEATTRELIALHERIGGKGRVETLRTALSLYEWYQCQVLAKGALLYATKDNVIAPADFVVRNARKRRRHQTPPKKRW